MGHIDRPCFATLLFDPATALAQGGIDLFQLATLAHMAAVVDHAPYRLSRAVPFTVLALKEAVGSLLLQPCRKLLTNPGVEASILKTQSDASACQLT